nr:DUF4158 domain-containing protein [Nocardia speluncae]
MFADQELERLRGFSEISREELFRYFALTASDLVFVDPGCGRGPADRLGLAIALCTLPWLGFVPDRLVTAPRVAVTRLAEQLGVDPVATAVGPGPAPRFLQLSAPIHPGGALVGVVRRRDRGGGAAGRGGDAARAERSRSAQGLR